MQFIRPCKVCDELTILHTELTTSYWWPFPWPPETACLGCRLWVAEMVLP